MLDPLVLAALGGVAALAGFVDAVAGGGGLFTVPALLLAGLPPVAALATNKMQSVIGTSVAAITFWRRGFVHLRSLLPTIAVTFAGSYTGALMVKKIETSALSIAVPIALIPIALYFLLAPKLSDQDHPARLRFAWFVPVMGAIVGFYDGIFGPGTGSFMTVGFVALFGLGLTRASAHTKVLNVTSNLAALALFIPSGDVIWPAAAVMAAGQVIGGYLGARTGIRFGVRIIRPLIIVVSLALAVKLLFFR